MEKNIAVEISPLITASGVFGDKSGVYRYTLGLLKGIINKINRENIDTKIYLFSFKPELLTYSVNPEILKLVDNEQIFLLGFSNKLQVTYKSDNNLIEFLSFPLIKLPLKLLDKLLNVRFLYKKYKEKIAFDTYIHSLEAKFKDLNIQTVIHSETGFMHLKDMKNIITVYDTTTILFPNLHREETCDLQFRKFKFAKNYCHAIIAISNSTKKDLLLLSQKFKNKHIIVGYPGVDETLIENVQTINDLNKLLPHLSIKKKKYFLYFSTFDPRKNIEYAVRAFTELKNEKEISQDIKFILIGGAGWGNVKKRIQNYIKETYLEPNNSPIILIDYIDDSYLSAFIQNAYAVVYPSLYEGFGLPVLESMALGTPVITSNTSSLPEVGGDSVLYVNPKDYFDVKNKMHYIVNYPEKAQELSQKGIEQSRKFTWDKTANKVFEFINNI